MFARLFSLLIVCTALALPASAPAASAATSTFATMISEPGDHVGQGQPRLFDQSNATFEVIGHPGELVIKVRGGTHGDYYQFDISAPVGEKLHTGHYARAAWTPSPGNPGMDISGSGRSCGYAVGRFDVKDILFDSAGNLQRLWMTYEQRCHPWPFALFGEIRIGVPRRIADWMAAGGHVWWPSPDLGRVGAVAPVWVGNSGTRNVTMAPAALSGRNRGDWSITGDGCAGRSLSPRGTCQVWLRFFPTIAGPRTATLLLKDSAGRTEAVALDGAATPGLTAVDLRGEQGDYIVGNSTFSYTPANAVIFWLLASRSHIRLTVEGDPGINGDWAINFAAAPGQVLAPGQYTATRWPFNAGPGFALSGNGRGCNQLDATFTIRTIAFTDGGEPRHLDASFEQHCEGGVPASYGDVQWRMPVGDVTPPAQVTDLRAVRDGSRVYISWANPSDSDFKTTIVRYLSGQHAATVANSGRLAYAGTGTTKTISVVRRPLAVAAFAVDTTGNVSTPQIVLLPAG